jgi:hypothetical protein
MLFSSEDALTFDPRYLIFYNKKDPVNSEQGSGLVKKWSSGTLAVRGYNRLGLKALPVMKTPDSRTVFIRPLRGGIFLFLGGAGFESWCCHLFIFIIFCN